MINHRRFWITAIIAWMIFIGIDFFFHASLFESLWKEDIDSIKPEMDLFILIPVGYFSFLLLTLLVGYSFTKIFQTKPDRSKVLVFSVTFGLLYSVSNLLGVYSYVNIPLKQLIIMNSVYFIEISAVVFIFYKATYIKKLNRILWYSIFTFFALLSFYLNSKGANWLR